MEEEEDTYCRFGTPLEPLDEDEMPSKKPIAIEDQVVTDENGKRRFHGAFTGGFSAGFWNTVGSLEGWKPQSFKSSRGEKSEMRNQRAIDFMDDEDLGEFGIAPQRVQTRDDFAPQDAQKKSNEQLRKRKLQQATGPIPGVPVLHQLLQPARENIAIRLLKKMGWKEGQGVGARQTQKEKKSTAERNARERYVMKMYGCDMGPAQSEAGKHDSDDDESDISDHEITFAPDDFEPFVCSIKMNTFGLGYQGLSRDPVLKKQQQHINLFENAFEVMGKDNKKLSIRGQAFGVGALEEEDEDIYARDDMTKYDFSLDESGKVKPKSKETRKIDQGVLAGFTIAQNASMYTKKIFTITLPPNYTPRNWAVRKSRFEPLDEGRATLLRKQDEYKSKGLGRHDLDPDQRGRILGEASSSVASTSILDNREEQDSEKPKKKTYLERINEKYRSKEALQKSNFRDKIASNFDNFTRGEVLNDDGQSASRLEEETRKENEKVLAEAGNITKQLDKTPSVFKPFIANSVKQDRYEKFLEQNLKGDDEITTFLTSIQPLSMTDWDREMEKKEFIQAKNIYRPLKGLMSDRFVSEAAVTSEREEKALAKIESDKTIKMVRTKTTWKPSSQLCKRFNIAEPFGGTLIDEKNVPKKPRFSVFDYLEMSVNTKENFVAPVIIPKNIEKPKPIIVQTDAANNNEKESFASRVSAKEHFANEANVTKIEWGRVTETKSTSTESSASKNSARKTSSKNKTPLEKKVEEMKNKHPSEKKDLFKAIFDSDSEDDNDKDKDAETEDKEANKSLDATQLLGIEAHKDIFASIKQSAAEINVLRNTSPPRGIFANLFTKKSGNATSSGGNLMKNEVKQVETSKTSAETKETISSPTQGKSHVSGKITFKSRNERELPPDSENIYGPKMPSTFPDATPRPPEQSISEAKGIDEKLLKLLKKSGKEGKLIEKWVEKVPEKVEKKKKKSDKEKDKKRKSKRHKKEKKRHKDKK